MSDDNALKDIDLSAWDVPSPETSADDLADSVIARVGGTEVGAAIPVDDVPLGGRKRALLIAGVAAAAIAVTLGVWVIARGARHAAPKDGAVIAEKAQALELDAAHADLDPGADIRWSRKGSVLRVEQRAGSAAWRVGTDGKLAIDAGNTGAVLASIEATGASLRVEVKPMNTADVKVMGAIATTAAVTALVTVVVYEGHVKVRDNGTQQTVIVQPGTTYTITPPPPSPEPFPVADDDSDDTSVVGVAPVGADQPPEVSIESGEDVFIHDMAPPTRVKIDTSKACRNGKVELVVNGVSTSSDTLAFNRGNMTYHVMCDTNDVGSGTVVVTRDPLSRPLPSPPPVNSVTADGRVYRVTYQQMPAIEVHGGPGTLHLSQGSVEKTYEARGDSVLIPSSDLAQGDYRFWFTPDKMTTLTLALDTTAPVVSLEPIVWGPQIELEGFVLAGSALMIDGVPVPVGSGRFRASVPGGSDTLILRIDHASAGTHYAIARQNGTTAQPNPVTVSQSPNSLDRSSITKVMASLKTKFAACVQQHPQTTRGIVKVKVVVKTDGSVNRVDVSQGVEAKLDECMRTAILPAKFPNATTETTFSYPITVEPTPIAVVPPANCDADAYKDKGMQNVNMGQHAAALAQFEASLRCKPDAYVQQLAYMSACNSQNAAKAVVYWKKMTKTQQEKYEPMCVRNHIDIRALAKGDDTDLTPPTCDADATKDKGMEWVNLGQHATALKLFEQSLACKKDAYVVALAFMAACNAQDADKARKYYAQLTPPQQTKYKIMCIANHIDPAASPSDSESDTDPDPFVTRPPSAVAQGYLQVFSKPKAKVFVDGVDSGKTTPIKGKNLALTPGKHKITFLIGDDRFTYPVVIQSGKTETMTKDLQ
ncbi:MAG TPA: hypothetical protein VMZ53_31700 [Kofleriaceae bacterium]|nr:hypothetical protein [Kofleriaceae bacterium]